jgi:hypothetical protein
MVLILQRTHVYFFYPRVGQIIPETEMCSRAGGVTQVVEHLPTTSFCPEFKRREGGKEGRKEGEKEERREGRKEGRKEGRRKGREEGKRGGERGEGEGKENKKYSRISFKSQTWNSSLLRLRQ